MLICLHKVNTFYLQIIRFIPSLMESMDNKKKRRKITGRECAAYNCKNAGTITFPKLKKLTNLWVKAPKRKNFKPSPYSVLCKEHFTESDFIRTIKYGLPLLRVKLKKEAIPSIFKVVVDQKLFVFMPCSTILIIFFISV